MTTNVLLECDGCFKKAGPVRIKREFQSFNGRGHGWGVVHTQTIDDVVPDGWVWSDPYTYCTYCPECWDSIENGEEDAA